MSKSQAARLGGLARAKHHGNPGTPEGRKTGGLRSLATHERLKTGFKRRKKIAIPLPSASLAEFIGIMLGDGHVGVYQASITTSATTDVAHARFVLKLFEDLFDCSATLVKRKANAIAVIISSRAVCDFLREQCLPNTNKVRGGIRLPTWVKRSRVYARACVRGLFDTDGCVYVDAHTIRNVRYRNLGLAFTNRNTDILDFFFDTLVRNGLHPTRNAPFTVSLRRREEIGIFFKIIGSSNPKHLKRYADFVS